MPIYEYRCVSCGSTFEHLARRMNEKTPACPSCGAKKPEKQLSTFSAGVASAALKPCSEGACPAGGASAGGCRPGKRCPL